MARFMISTAILTCLVFGVVDYLAPLPDLPMSPAAAGGKGKAQGPKSCALEPGVECPPCTRWHPVRCECVKIPPSRCRP